MPGPLSLTWTAIWSSLAVALRVMVVPGGVCFRALSSSASKTSPRLLSALKVYLKLQQLSADWESIEGAPDERLITSLSMICPFSCREKQALLESPCLAERARVLTALLEMAVLQGGAGPDAQPN